MGKYGYVISLLNYEKNRLEIKWDAEKGFLSGKTDKEIRGTPYLKKKLETKKHLNSIKQAMGILGG
jgi:hypothetical protein